MFEDFTPIHSPSSLSQDHSQDPIQHPHHPLIDSTPWKRYEQIRWLAPLGGHKPSGTLDSTFQLFPLLTHHLFRLLLLRWVTSLEDLQEPQGVSLVSLTLAALVLHGGPGSGEQLGSDGPVWCSNQCFCGQECSEETCLLRNGWKPLPDLLLCGFVAARAPELALVTALSCSFRGLTYVDVASCSVGILVRCKVR